MRFASKLAEVCGLLCVSPTVAKQRPGKHIPSVKGNWWKGRFLFGPCHIKRRILSLFHIPFCLTLFFILSMFLFTRLRLLMRFFQNFYANSCFAQELHIRFFPTLFIQLFHVNDPRLIFLPFSIRGPSFCLTIFRNPNDSA
jgi:fumarate reductase subunit C